MQQGKRVLYAPDARWLVRASFEYLRDSFRLAFADDNQTLSELEQCSKMQDLEGLAQKIAGRAITIVSGNFKMADLALLVQEQVAKIQMNGGLTALMSAKTFKSYEADAAGNGGGNSSTASAGVRVPEAYDYAKQVENTLKMRSEEEEGWRLQEQRDLYCPNRRIRKATGKFRPRGGQFPLAATGMPFGTNRYSYKAKDGTG
ncbi:hypothetical protein BDZ91DRAFT_812632 [Kalaharituber pfeilii]|nr:hypothetical protein BDZ91DRAFT_812632 [Kalaharituber pfeilii]